MRRQISGNRLTGHRAARLTAAAGLLLAMLLIAAGALPAHADVEPPPQIPHEFSGTVFVDGAPVAEGTPVQALVDDVEGASTAVDDQSRYSLLVSGPGTTVTFRVGGVLANETATWESGTIDEDFYLTVGAPPPSLTISSTFGGSVTEPGEGEFIYFKGTVVELVASPAAGYYFINWTGNVTTVADRNSAWSSIIMQGDYAITANFEQAPTPPSFFPFPLPCFIATAAYGSPTAGQIDVLREFRDVALLESTLGSRFVAWYYRTSRPVAEVIAGNEVVRMLVREFLVDPAVWIVKATAAIWQTP